MQRNNQKMQYVRMFSTYVFATTECQRENNLPQVRGITYERNWMRETEKDSEKEPATITSTTEQQLKQKFSKGSSSLSLLFHSFVHFHGQLLQLRFSFFSPKNRGAVSWASAVNRLDFLHIFIFCFAFIHSSQKSLIAFICSTVWCFSHSFRNQCATFLSIFLCCVKCARSSRSVSPCFLSLSLSLIIYAFSAYSKNYFRLSSNLTKFSVFVVIVAVVSISLFVCKRNKSVIHDERTFNNNNDGTQTKRLTKRIWNKTIQ